MCIRDRCMHCEATSNIEHSYGHLRKQAHQSDKRFRVSVAMFIAKYRYALHTRKHAMFKRKCNRLYMYSRFQFRSNIAYCVLRGHPRKVVWKFYGLTQIAYAHSLSGAGVAGSLCVSQLYFRTTFRECPRNTQCSRNLL